MSPMLHANPPLLGPAPRILVLGSFPGPASLRTRTYYAHPQNAFWKVMGAILGFAPADPYPDRVRALVGAGIAVWDVVERCSRDGSGDADIRDPEPADVPGLMASHPTLVRVVFNGKSVARLYRRLVGPPPASAVVAPSTSPAAARLTLAAKIEAWREALAVLAMVAAFLLPVPSPAQVPGEPSPASASPVPSVASPPPAAAVPASPRPRAGSVRVGPVRVEAPGAPRDRFLAVSLAIGERPLWQSSTLPAPSASWPVRLRAFTAKGHPLVFRVVAVPPARGPLPVPPPPADPARPSRRSRTVREQDATIASALPDLIADYGSGTLDDPGEPRGPPDPSLHALPRSSSPLPAPARCRADLSWPPVDGEHRLSCGPFTIVVETRWLDR